MKTRSDPWDKRLMKWIDWNWEFIAVSIFFFLLGVCFGALAVMIQHQHQIISLLEQTK